MKIFAFKCQGLAVIEDQGGASEQGLGYAGPEAQRLGSTGTLGRRVRWADGHAGLTGRTGPADGPWRPRKLRAAESAKGVGEIESRF